MPMNITQQPVTVVHKVATYDTRAELKAAFAEHGLSATHRPPVAKLAAALGVDEVRCLEAASSVVKAASARTLVDIEFRLLNKAGNPYGAVQHIDSITVTTDDVREATNEAKRNGRYSNSSWTRALAFVLTRDVTKGKLVELDTLVWSDPHTAETARKATQPDAEPTNEPAQDETPVEQSDDADSPADALVNA